MTQTLLIEEFVTTGLGWQRKNPNRSGNSQKNYRNHLNQFERFLTQREKTIHTVDNADIEQYIDDLKQSGYKPNTVAVKTAAISSYFKWMKHNEIISCVPAIKMQPHCMGVHKKIPTKALLAVFDTMNGNSLKETRDTAMISLIAFFGFKTEAVVALNMGDVCLLHGAIKGKPVNEVLRQLQKYAQARAKTNLSEHADDPFFVNRSKTRISGRSLRRHLCKYFSDAGINEIYSTRDLQYTYQCANPTSNPKDRRPLIPY